MKSLSTKTLVYLALLSFGLSLCFSLQLSNLSAIFRFLGADGSDLPWLWLAPPLTGLLIQPLIGQMSDDTNTRYGKRLPYIFFWGVLAAIASFIFPYMRSLGLLVLVTIIIDCSLNGGTEALRALTGDLFSNESQRSSAFALQAFAAGIGGAIGAGLPLFIYNISDKLHFSVLGITGSLPPNLQLSFVLSAVILLSIIVALFYKVKERTFKQNVFNKKKKPFNFKNRVTKLSLDFYNSFRKMPARFKKICFIHAISWSGIFIFWLYFSTAIAQNVYGLPAHSNALVVPKFADIWQKATLDTAFYFSIYQYVSIAYAVLLYFISQKYNKNIIVHAISLLAGGLAIALTPFETTSLSIELAMIAYGIMWGSMLVLPYAIAIKYLPKGKLGVYLGIFNICITAPQILCSLSLSSIYSYLFHDNASHLLALGGCLILLSSYLWYTLSDVTFKFIPNLQTAILRADENG